MWIARQALWVLPASIAAIGGYTDYRWRRIPNWLTLPAVLLGIVVNSILSGWAGTRESLLGTGLGLLILLPIVSMKGMGMGDLKFVTAFGAFLGPSHLIAVLVAAIFINAFIALTMVIWKRRVRQTIRNLGHMLVSLLTLHLPGPELTLDNPQLVKVPFGVALAIGIFLYTAAHYWGKV